MINIYKEVLLTNILTVCLQVPAWAECTPGVYGNGQHNVVVIAETIENPSSGSKYLMLDGRFGTTLSASTPFHCSTNFITLNDEEKTTNRFVPIPLTRTKTTFKSAEAILAGELIEPTPNCKSMFSLILTMACMNIRKCLMDHVKLPA